MKSYISINNHARGCIYSNFKQMVGVVPEVCDMPQWFPLNSTVFVMVKVGGSSRSMAV